MILILQLHQQHFLFNTFHLIFGWTGGTFFQFQSMQLSTPKVQTLKVKMSHQFCCVKYIVKLTLFWTNISKPHPDKTCFPQKVYIELICNNNTSQASILKRHLLWSLCRKCVCCYTSKLAFCRKPRRTQYLWPVCVLQLKYWSTGF